MRFIFQFKERKKKKLICSQINKNILIFICPSNKPTEKANFLFASQDFSAFFFLSIVSFHLGSQNRLLRCWRTLVMIFSSSIMHASYSPQGIRKSCAHIFVLLWGLHTDSLLCAVSMSIVVSICARCLCWKLFPGIKVCLWYLLFPYLTAVSLFYDIPSPCFGLPIVSITKNNMKGHKELVVLRITYAFLTRVVIMLYSQDGILFSGHAN